MSKRCHCHGFEDCTYRPLDPNYPMTPPTPDDIKKKIQRASLVTDVLDDVRAEVTRAMAKFPPFNSAHEGWAVLYEEVDELWEDVRAKQGDRRLEDMRAEAIQVAAMAVRFALDICNPEKVQK